MKFRIQFRGWAKLLDCMDMAENLYIPKQVRSRRLKQVTDREPCELIDRAILSNDRWLHIGNDSVVEGEQNCAGKNGYDDQDP